MLCFLASWRIPRSLSLYFCLLEFSFHRRPSFLDTKRPRPAPILLILFLFFTLLLVLGKTVGDILPLLHVHIPSAAFAKDPSFGLAIMRRFFSFY
jgi:hypothetical protein